MLKEKVKSYAETIRDEAEQEGIEKGRQENQLEIARNLLDILDDKTIAEKVGLDINKIAELRKNN